MAETAPENPGHAYGSQTLGAERMEKGSQGYLASHLPYSTGPNSEKVGEAHCTLSESFAGLTHRCVQGKAC